MIIISFDAVGNDQFDRLAEYPAFSALMKQSTVNRNVSTVFQSNTYPIHASVATGVLPRVHGICGNTDPFPSRHPLWNTRESSIKAKTIWQAAHEKGIDTAAVLWPVTAFSKTIRYNIPEVLARPGDNQVITSLKAGSKGLQLKMYLRHRGLLDFNIKQPNLDCFSAACMADILREKKPGLALIHFTAYDFLCHEHGKDSGALKIAFDSLDQNLQTLMDAITGDRDVILFSDHSQLNVHTVLDPNRALVKAGLLRFEHEEYVLGEYGCFVECAGGSALFHPGALSKSQIQQWKSKIENSEGFRRFLTDEEMYSSGLEHAAFGFCAKLGYCYEAHQLKEKATHGYPLDMPDYTVFYMVRGQGFAPGAVKSGGSLLDIAKLAAKHLGLSL